METNNVANNLFGLFLNFPTNLNLSLLDNKDFFKSVEDSEKKATSEPEIKAEDIIKKDIKMNLIRIS